MKLTLSRAGRFRFDNCSTVRIWLLGSITWPKRLSGMDICMHKLVKASRLVSHAPWRHALLRHHVAASLEHAPLADLIEPRTILDVGANRSQFALRARSTWPNAQIVTFEPIPTEAAIFTRVLPESPYTDRHWVTAPARRQSICRPGSTVPRCYRSARARQRAIPARRRSARCRSLCVVWTRSSTVWPRPLCSRSMSRATRCGRSRAPSASSLAHLGLCRVFRARALYRAGASRRPDLLARRTRLR